MYVRFVSGFRNKRSRHKLGVIRAAAYLQETFSKGDREQLEELFGWFNDFLIVPNKFAKSKNPYAEHKALSWFKDSADLHIRKVREIAEVLERNNVSTEMLTTKTPGYVVYEDDHQIVAVPFSDTM